MIDEIGNLIVKEQKDTKKLEQDISKLDEEVKKLQAEQSNWEVQMQKLSSQNAHLMSYQQELEQKIIDVIANELAFDLINDVNVTKNSDSLITNEIFDILSKATNSELNELIITYEKNQNLILTQDKIIQDIKENMQEFSNKKDDLNKKVASQEQKVANLKKNKDEYAKRLEKISNEQDEMQKTLQELKIIDDREEKEKARKLEEKRQAELKAKKLEEERKKSEKAKKDDKTKDKKDEIKEEIQEEPVIDDERVAKIDKKVKQYGSSYQASRVKKYKGAKTISPLSNATVKRKFGNYTDPVYNIKIFNESIVLASSSDTQVKSVLPGKVVFAKETAVLDKVVILKHNDGIHTIYAHLNQISPTIKVGNNIKKGYVLGRVKSDLTFEVTQENYHINPLDLISLK